MYFRQNAYLLEIVGNEFAFTASEQEFYAQKGFANEPGRCPECRAARKAEYKGSNRGGIRPGRRQMYEATCANCGKIAWYHLSPSGDRPVYCKDGYLTASQEEIAGRK
jgi:CxxC-x17-CxxC domain-containing protein